MTEKKGPERRITAPNDRVIITHVQPEIDGGRFPIKRTAGEKVVVTADIYTDGHEALAAQVLFRASPDEPWSETPMQPLVNDRWQGSFRVTAVGRAQYTVRAWIDRFLTWQRDLKKKVEAGQDVGLDLWTGVELIQRAAQRASGPTSGEDAGRLADWASRLNAERRRNVAAATALALDDELALVVARHPDLRLAALYEKELDIVVDRERARFSAWYEMFPRSCAREPGRHGTFRDCEERLAYVAAMGFDVLYFPPIHPVGRVYRKGKNNATVAEPGDVGSPWAIGAEEGGHTAILPELGTLDDFRRLVARARDFGLEIALDIAFQCTPDHPWVKQHPDWFRHRPDGSIQYAENPPKKYQDIYPLDFDTEDWEALWEELKGVFFYWAAEGIRIFRVDNPHTKPFAFWEWVIGEIKEKYPEAIFLSEAFTRPKVKYNLAKLGFTQSYNYFPWRNTKWELTEYLTELTQTEVREFFRPSLWPNTPDILTEYLQFGGRPAFMTRLVLAATLGASYGIYGAAFELCENKPREPGSEEYLNAEKYEIKQWDIARPDSLKDLITQVNRIRRENPCLQSDHSLRFHPVDNEQLIAYTKMSEDQENLVLVVVNLDPHHTQSGSVDLPLDSLGISPQQPYQAHDLLTDARYLWNGPRNYVELNPQVLPAHILQLRRKARREQDSDHSL